MSKQVRVPFNRQIAFPDRCLVCGEPVTGTIDYEESRTGQRTDAMEGAPAGSSVTRSTTVQVHVNGLPYCATHLPQVELLRRRDDFDTLMVRSLGIAFAIAPPVTVAVGLLSGEWAIAFVAFFLSYLLAWGAAWVLIRWRRRRAPEFAAVRGMKLNESNLLGVTVDAYFEALPKEHPKAEGLVFEFDDPRVEREFRVLNGV